MIDEFGEIIFRGYGYRTRSVTNSGNFRPSLKGCQHGDIKIFKVDKDGKETLDRIQPAHINYVDIGRGDDFKIGKYNCIDCGMTQVRAVKLTWQIRCTPCAKEHKRKLAGKTRARARAKVKANANAA